MREALEKRCQAFIANRDTLKSVFKMENAYMYPVCANIFCARDMLITGDSLRAANDLLKANVGVFSNFRGTARLAVVSLLAASAEPDEKVRQMLDNYTLLKEYFFGSEYLALVALLLTETGSAHPVAETVARGREIYNRMKKEHRFLTSSEDSIFAVLLAQSDKSDDYLIADMEDCYQKLKSTFHAGDDLQAVTHVLSLAEGTTLDKCARLIALFEGIGKAGGKYGKYHELPVLAALSVLPVDVNQAVSDIMDAEAFLSGQKGYGFWGLGKKARLSHAVMLVADEYAPNPSGEAAALASTVAMIAAQQAALCASIAASSAHSAASH